MSFYLVLFALQAYALEDATMRLSVGAIRYLSPTWDMVEPGEYLWPALLYWFNIKEHTGQRKASTHDKDQNSESLEGSDEGDVTWTL